MELNDLRKEPHLSASSIGDYIDCGLLYKLGRIDRQPPEFRADALEFGSCVHLALADFHKPKKDGKTMTAKELHERFEKYWRAAAEGYEDIQYAEGKNFNTLLMEGKELLTTYYHKCPHEQFKVLAIEEPFSFTLEGCPIKIIGAFDLVEEDESGTIVIVDWKTSGRAYSADEVDRNFQLTLYQMAAKANGHADREILLRFDCLIKTKTPKFEQYYTSRTENDFRRAEKKINEVWRGISNGVFIPNDGSQNWRCRNCSHKTHCDEWFERSGP